MVITGYNQGMANEVPENQAESTASSKPTEPAPQERRRFFSEVFKQALTPIAAIIEKRVTPMTDALQGKSPFLDDDDFGDEALAPMEEQSPQPRVILRPPGAVPAGEFESVCSRCGMCAEACPVKCIHLDRHDMVAGGFPYIVPEVAPCAVCEDLSCMKACPSGALKLVDRLAIRIGLAEVNHTLCLRTNGEDCRLCLDACPIGESAIVVSNSSGRVIVKYHGCIGCGMCEQACPTQPSAIVINPRPDPTEPIVA